LPTSTITFHRIVSGPISKFFIDAARRAGIPVLEIACGTGRVLIPLANAGVEIVRLDASARHARGVPPAARGGTG
jgi:2-polyprenyl-3-methyl-5-hydroxy-6-metoxy-1,4-benzoquinol methylase